MEVLEYHAWLVALSWEAAQLVSRWLARLGRRAGVVVGARGGALGGAVAAYGLSIASFPLFLVWAFLSGVYQSSEGFFRFAAADSASDAFRPKAISWVMAGGLGFQFPLPEEGTGHRFYLSLLITPEYSARCLP